MNKNITTSKSFPFFAALVLLSATLTGCKWLETTTTAIYIYTSKLPDDTVTSVTVDTYDDDNKRLDNDVSLKEKSDGWWKGEIAGNSDDVCVTFTYGKFLNKEYHTAYSLPGVSFTPGRPYGVLKKDVDVISGKEYVSYEIHWYSSKKDAVEAN